jgi:SAM-dependent methyltransferase
MRNVIRQTIRPIFKTLQYTALMQAVEEEFEIQSYSGATSRHFEYPFGISELVELNKKSSIKSVLDAGSYGSPFALILAGLGFKVTGVDLIDWDIVFPNYQHVVGDLKSLPFDDNQFDAITSISTMEHLGLPRFGEKVIKDGDVMGVKDLVRVLKPGGFLVLTVPYAQNSALYQNKHRVYNKSSFKRLIGKLVVKKERFFAPIDDPRMFRPCTKQEIESFKSVNGSHGVICIIGQKPKTARN